jgi:hypothetical protein
MRGRLSPTPAALIASTRSIPLTRIAATMAVAARDVKSGGDSMRDHGLRGWRRRMPRHEMTASCPANTLASASPASTSHDTNDAPLAASNAASGRMTAVTPWPRASAWLTT